MDRSNRSTSFEVKMTKNNMEMPRNVGIVARLYQACIDIIKTIVLQEVNDQSLQTYVLPLRRIHHSLVLWDSDHSVGKGDLDIILQRSRRLQEATLVPLRSMALILAFGLMISMSPVILLLIGPYRYVTLCTIESSRANT